MGYVPDWTVSVDEEDPGHRLLQAFARLSELLVERLNQVPENNFLSFLDFAGVERFPGAPAEVPVTFVVSKRAPLGGIVPAGTQVATTQTKKTDARVFETRRDVFASRARVASTVAVHPATDRYVVVPVSEIPATAESLAAATPLRVLTDTGPGLQDVDHVLYLASEQVFGRKDVAEVRIRMMLISGALPSAITWRRFSKSAKAWIDLPAPTVNTSVAGQVDLTFSNFIGVDKASVDNVEDFWIAGEFTGPFSALPTPPVISAITGAVTPVVASGPLLDAAFYNAAPLDFTKPFSPYGPRPAYGDALYLGSAVAFSPSNESVTLTFTIRPYVHAALQTQFAGLPTGGLTVRTTARWQYLDTNGVWRLLSELDHSFQFAATTGAVSRPSPSAGEGAFIGGSDGDTTAVVTFSTFPSDIGLQTVNGVESYWLRVLLISENPYGIDGVLTGTGSSTRFIGPLFIPPRVDSVAIAFAPRTNPIAMNHVTTLNNFVFRDDSSSASVTPFREVASRMIGAISIFGNAPAFYIGFDRQLEIDAFVSIFFDLAGPSSSLTSPLESGNPRIAWEYWSDAGGWRPLDVTDDSLDLTTSGSIAFVAPRDAASLSLFTRIEPDVDADVAARWWLRARLASGTYDYPPTVRGVYINTVAAENRTTVVEVLIGSSNGEPDQTFALVRGPVLAGELWVRETETPTAEELYELDVEHAEAEGLPAPPLDEASPNLTSVGDDATEVWVRWLRVPNFRLSGPRSRHYLLDSVAAIVRFGSGSDGHIPPVGRNNLVFRDLQTGGGANANLEAGPLAVKELKTTLPFIDKVFNVQSASAGASPWTIEQFEEFGPQALKNRGRSVTTEDYQWMVRQRFSDVARVRCIAVHEPGPGGTLAFKAGGVTAIVVPWSTDPRPQPSQGLIRKVREFLAQNVLTNIVADVHVKGPDYVAVDVEAQLAPTRPEFALVVARKAQAALDAFLHPLTGGEDGSGYGFGRPVFLSEVEAVLERIDEVDHVVSAGFVAFPGLDQFPVTGERLASSGTHRITVV